MRAVIGVDPGVRGGLALLGWEGHLLHVRAFQPSMTHGELVEAVRVAAFELHKLDDKPTAFIEKVGYMPTDGGQGAFTFGRVDGLLRGALLMANCQVRDVMPLAWQSRMNCPTGGDKNVSKARAQQLFPRAKITHSVADALLIARYGWECLRTI